MTASEPAMRPRTGAHALLEALEGRGVRYLFGIPGHGAYPIFDALNDVPAIRPIVGRNEQGNTFSALGYAWASGETAVATSVPAAGLLNAATPLAEATATQERILFLLEHDRVHADVLRSIALHHRIVDDAADIAPAATDLLDAIEVGTAGRRGARGPEPPAQRPGRRSADRGPLRAGRRRPPIRRRSPRRPDPSLHPAASRSWPVPRRSAAHRRTPSGRIAEALQAPVFTDGLVRGIPPDDHPLAMGHTWTPGGPGGALPRRLRCPARRRSPDRGGPEQLDLGQPDGRGPPRRRSACRNNSSSSTGTTATRPRSRLAAASAAMSRRCSPHWRTPCRAQDRPAPDGPGTRGLARPRPDVRTGADPGRAAVPRRVLRRPLARRDAAHRQPRRVLARPAASRARPASPALPVGHRHARVRPAGRGRCRARPTGRRDRRGHGRRRRALQPPGTRDVADVRPQGDARRPQRRQLQRDQAQHAGGVRTLDRLAARQPGLRRARGVVRCARLQGRDAGRARGGHRGRTRRAGFDPDRGPARDAARPAPCSTSGSAHRRPTQPK